MFFTLWSEFLAYPSPRYTPLKSYKIGLVEFIHSRLFSYLFCCQKQRYTLSRVLFNKYSIAIALSAIVVKGINVMRQTRKMKAVSASTAKENKLKRKLIDEDDDALLNPGFLDSEEEGSGFVRSGDREGSEAKRVKRCLRFNSKELESRFKTLDLSSRKIIYGHPVSGKAFLTCGSVKLFTALGFESFIMDLPKECYHEYVKNSMQT